MSASDRDHTNFDSERWSEHSAIPRRTKTGGRKKGTPNKRTVERAKAIDAIKASGRDPITFFSDLLRNEEAPLNLRFQAAKELAPYVHPKLASVESRPCSMSHEERLERLLKMAEDDRPSKEGGVP
jgi:hypothetical protein